MPEFTNDTEIVYQWTEGTRDYRVLRNGDKLKLQCRFPDKWGLHWGRDMFGRSAVVRELVRQMEGPQS